MPETTPRIEKLMGMLQRQPNEIFLLYALAMEHRKTDNHAQALYYLNEVLKHDRDYLAAYQMAGQVHELAGDFVTALRTYEAGIEAAGRKNDNHARDEMAAARDALKRRSA